MATKIELRKSTIMSVYHYVAIMGRYGTFKSEICMDDWKFILSLATYIDLLLKSTITRVYRYIIS